MITIVQLEYIIALDTYRHFVTAAEKCFVTQPTLSMQLKKLESELGISIFDRSKQPIIPTEIGQKLIDQARIVVKESKKIKEIVADFSNSTTGELSIGIIPSLAPYLLPLFIGGFTEKYPNIKVRIVELVTEEIINHLRKGLIDVGLLVTPLSEKDMIEQPLFYEEILLYVNKNHPFAAKEDVKTSELASPDLWLLSHGHCFRSQVINLCSYKANLKENYHFEYDSGSLETIKKLVEIEGGFTLLPELAANRDTIDSKAIAKYFNFSRPLREVSFVYTRNYAKKRLLGLLSEEIINAIPEKMKRRDRGQVVEWR